MPVRTVSAVRVLPAAPLRQVSEALGGGACCLGMPSRRNLNRLGRNRYIQDLHAQGYSAADIASRLFVSERTVWRVQAKAASPPPACSRPRPAVRTPICEVL